MFARGGTGTNPDLQTALNDAGFNLLVHDNDPAVDPAIFLDEDFQMGRGTDKSGRVARTNPERPANERGC